MFTLTIPPPGNGKLAVPVTGKFGSYAAEFTLQTSNPGAKLREGWLGAMDKIEVVPEGATIRVRLWNTTLDPFRRDGIFSIYEEAPASESSQTPGVVSQDWRTPPQTMARFELTFILPA